MQREESDLHSSDSQKSCGRMKRRITVDTSAFRRASKGSHATCPCGLLKDSRYWQDSTLDQDSTEQDSSIIESEGLAYQHTLPAQDQEIKIPIVCTTSSAAKNAEALQGVQIDLDLPIPRLMRSEESYLLGAMKRSSQVISNDEPCAVSKSRGNVWNVTSPGAARVSGVSLIALLEKFPTPGQLKIVPVGLTGVEFLGLFLQGEYIQSAVLGCTFVRDEQQSRHRRESLRRRWNVCA
eukprot:GHVU01029969.1.p1 GENE.GHVU01029969.1~~GHVU01029969.1.p1  ORF type:complete len:237 (+),score=8.83 GHVU01029969.1:2754-3464(+)